MIEHVLIDFESKIGLQNSNDIFWKLEMEEND